jgi:hypothetical protein
MEARFRRAAAALAGLGLIGGGGARADERAGDRADLPARLADRDTADGRIEGDLGVVVGAGARFSERAPQGALEARLRYLETAGLFVTYEDGFGAAAAVPARVMATGLEVRPMFLGRWVTGTELGLRWADLTIDSLGLEVAAVFEQPPLGSFGSRTGLQVGLGLELPVLGRTNGPWIDVHGGVRWSDDVMRGGPIGGPSDRQVFLQVTVALHWLFATHTVDLNDEAP